LSVSLELGHHLAGSGGRNGSKMSVPNDVIMIWLVVQCAHLEK
jgi:hypothetical protein